MHARIMHSIIHRGWRTRTEGRTVGNLLGVLEFISAKCKAYFPPPRGNKAHFCEIHFREHILLYSTNKWKYFGNSFSGESTSCRVIISTVIDISSLPPHNFVICLSDKLVFVLFLLSVAKNTAPRSRELNFY